MRALIRDRYGVLIAIFFASGLAALIDQILWQRLLTLVAGADAYAVIVVVAAFMGGMGCGSLVGGHVADRLSARGRVLAFAVAELAVAGFTFASPVILYDALYLTFGGIASSPLTIGMITFGILLWPTFFIGLSLPLLARAATDDAARPDESVSRLYGWNTFGAGIGALLTVTVILRAMDIRHGLQLSASIDVAVAACAVAVARRFSNDGDVRPPRAAGHDVRSQPDSATASRFGLTVWLLLYGLSGFIALSLELVWFRLLDVAIRPTAFTFGVLLAVYLLGTGIGALIANHRLARAVPPLPMFLRLQSGIALYSALSLAGLVAVSGRLPMLQLLWDYWAGSNAAPSVSAALRSIAGPEVALLLTLYGVVPLYLMGPPTLMMGMSFGYLQRAVQTDLSHLGRRIGWLQAANVCGAVLGVLITGLVLLHWFGSAGTLRIVVALGGIFLWLAAKPITRRLAAALATAATVAIVPSSVRLWASLHGRAGDEIIFREDRTGLSVLKRDGADTSMFSNGTGVSRLPYRGIHTALGVLPVLLHPQPVSIAVVGLGSGNTAFALGARRETLAIDCLEIAATELSALRLLDHQRPDPGLAALLRDPRVRHIAADGRAFITKSATRYDVIEADPLEARHALSGNLHSLEFFLLLRRHLNPGGLVVVFGQTPRTVYTFITAFPYVVVLDDILIGSNDPIAFDAEVLRGRLADPFTRQYFLTANVDVWKAIDPFLTVTPTRYGPTFDREGLADINHDLFPKDEFLLPQPDDHPLMGNTRPTVR